MYDANTFRRNELIGQFAFGLQKVRDQPPPSEHQLKERWVTLVDPNNPQEEQGYLKISVTVLCTGDSAPSQPSIIGNTDAIQTKKGSELSLLRPLKLKRRGYNFSIKVFRGEHLRKPYLDTFLVFKFNGTIMKTTVCKNSAMPEWNRVLVIPVFTPCFSDVVEIQLWNSRVASPDVLLSRAYIPFSRVLSNPLPPTWFNFYGPCANTAAAIQWLQNLVGVDERVSNDFLGRYLISLDVQLADVPVSEERMAAPIQPPSLDLYVLCVDLYQASELPIKNNGEVMVEVNFGPEKNKRSTMWCKNERRENGTYVVRFKCDANSSAFGSISNTGECQFKQLEVLIPRRDLSHYVTEVYDIILNVYSRSTLGSKRKIGFVRLDGTRLFQTAPSRRKTVQPEWHPVVNLYRNKGTVCTKGFLLVDCSLRLAKDQLTREVIKPIEMKDFHLRAHIYQGKKLKMHQTEIPLTSFIEISIAGHRAKLVYTNPAKWASMSQDNGSSTYSTTQCLHSDNPVWFETLAIDRISLPSDLSRAPGVSVVAKCSINGKVYVIGDHLISASSVSNDAPRRPIWIPLNNENRSLGGDSFAKLRDTGPFLGRSINPNDNRTAIAPGEVLLKLELISFEESRSRTMYDWEWPKVIPANVHVKCIGLRRLQKFQNTWGKVENPYIRVSCESFPDMNKVSAAVRSDMTGMDDTENGSDRGKMGVEEKSTSKGTLSDSLRNIYVRQPQRSKGSALGDTMFGGQHVHELQSKYVETGRSDFNADEEREIEQANKIQHHPAGHDQNEVTFLKDVVFHVNIPEDGYFFQPISVVVWGKGKFSDVLIGKGSFHFKCQLHDSNNTSVQDSSSAAQYETSLRPDSMRKNHGFHISAHTELNDVLPSSHFRPYHSSKQYLDAGEGHYSLPNAVTLDMKSINYDVQSEISDDLDDAIFVDFQGIDSEMMKLVEPASLVSLTETSHNAITMLWPGASITNGTEKQTDKEVLCDLESTSILGNLFYKSLGLKKSLGLNKSETCVFKYISHVNLIGSETDAFDVRTAHTGKARLHNSASLAVSANKRFQTFLESDFGSIIESPLQLTARLYIVDIKSLIPQAYRGKPNPYLIVSLKSPSGNLLNPIQAGRNHPQCINGRSNFKTGTINPFYGTRFDFTVTLPDVTEILIEVWDAGLVSDSMIGSTSIDIEDRWFSREWQALKSEGAIPREYRPLWHPKAAQAQGKLCLWLEMYHGKEAMEVPLHDLRLSEAKDWELRIVVWETRRVPRLENHSTYFFIPLHIFFFSWFFRLDRHVYHWRTPIQRL